MNMVSVQDAHHPTAPRLRFALIATITACIVALLASLNLYLLEDGNSLTTAAYSASPLLRFSYDGIYLTALLAFLAACAIVTYTFTRAARADTSIVISLIIIACLIAFAGFGGLLIRYPVTFLILFATFAALTLISFLVGRSVASRLSTHLESRTARMSGACVNAGLIVLINTLNPVSHPLFMQGLIGGTSWNSLLIAMGIELLAFIIAGISIVRALRAA
jgi:hypothetical protein